MGLRNFKRIWSINEGPRFKQFRQLIGRMTSYNCSTLVKDLFFENDDGVGKKHLLIFAKLFCDHLDKIRNTTKGNFTAVELIVQDLCCTLNLNTQLCELPGNLDKNMTHALNCSQSFGEKVPVGVNDLYTYILLALLLPIGIAGNLLILFAILRYKCLPKQTGKFLCSMAAADLGVIFEFIAFLVYHNHDGDNPDRVHRYLFPSFDIFFASVSLLQITVISIERAIAVTWPFKYQSYVSSKREKKTVICIWSFSLILMFAAFLRIPIHSEIYSLVIFFTATTTMLFIPVVLIIISYTLVVVSAYQNLRQDRKRMKMFTIFIKQGHPESELLNGRPKSARKGKLSAVRCREIKLSVNVALIVLPFLFCWVFYIFVHIYEHVMDYQFSSSSFVNWFIFHLPFTVSSMNPVFYLLLTRSLRNTVKLMIQRKIKSKLNRADLSIITVSSATTGITGRRTSSINLGVPKKASGRDLIQNKSNEDVLCKTRTPESVVESL